MMTDKDCLDFTKFVETLNEKSKCKCKGKCKCKEDRGDNDLTLVIEKKDKKIKRLEKENKKLKEELEFQKHLP